MAPLPANSTARVFLDYTGANQPHTFEFRLGSSSTVASATAQAAAVAAVLATRMSDLDSITAARYQAAGSLFSLPITFTPVVGAVPNAGGAAFWVEDPESAFISITGRGQTSGREVAWYLFTPVKSTTWPTDNRYNPGDSAPVDTFRINFSNLVTAAPSPSQQMVTIGGDIPLIRGYTNIAKNGYWQRKQR